MIPLGGRHRQNARMRRAHWVFVRSPIMRQDEVEVTLLGDDRDGVRVIADMDAEGQCAPEKSGSGTDPRPGAC